MKHNNNSVPVSFREYHREDTAREVLRSYEKRIFSPLLSGLVNFAMCAATDGSL
jgi:hypothetical protein